MPFPRIAFAVCALLLVDRAALAQMIPLTDDREIVTNVRYDGMSDRDAQSPPGAFAPWFGIIQSNVSGTASGGSHAQASQSSSFDPGSINFSGGTAGGWSVISRGNYDAKSHLRWTVRANQCLAYSLYMSVQPGKPTNQAYVDVSGPGGLLFHVAAETLSTAGRLPSGDYVFEADAPLASAVENGEGGTYNLIWQCSVCPSSLIATQPADATVPCDAVAVFCVGPNGPAGSFTYQWRRNYVPLTNTTHYSGVRTPCLSIQHACYADDGYFDVLVTSGATTEPSRGAHVIISSIAVGVPPSADLAWSLGVGTPSPSRATTSFRYAAPAPFRARATIHDTAGRVVRQLVDGLLEGSGTLVWDGRSGTGSPAVPGIYFLRFERDRGVDVRRIVRVR